MAENLTEEVIFFIEHYNKTDIGPKRDTLSIVIPITIIYGIIFITGLIGNVSTCIVIARNKSMHTATNYYLFSLAISDLLLLVSGLPPEIYSIWSRYPYVFGYTFCILRGLFAETSANATVLTITAFTVERYVAICHPFLSHTMSKLSRVIKLILLIWLVAICFAIPQALQFGLTAVYDDPELIMCHIVNPIMKYSFEMSTCLFFVLPMTIITVLYAMIGVRLKSSSMMNKNTGDLVKNVGQGQNSSQSCKHQHGKSSKRILKMLVAVVVAFFICWAPFHTQRLVAIYVFLNNDKDSNSLKIYEVVTYISGILYFVSTTINPVLYNIMSNKFREAFKETFTRCFKLSRLRSGSPAESYSVLSRSTKRGPESGNSDRNDPSLQTHTTITYKSSIDSINVQSSGRRSLMDAKDPNQIQKSFLWTRGNSHFCVTMVSKTNVEEITPNTKLVSVEVSALPPSKTKRFFLFLICSNKKARTDFYKNTKTSGKKCEANTAMSGPFRSFDEISNSSLKDYDPSAIRDELSTYMQKVNRKQTSP